MKVVSTNKLGRKRLSDHDAVQKRVRNVNYKAQNEALWNKKLSHISDLYKEKRTRLKSVSPKQKQISRANQHIMHRSPQLQRVQPAIDVYNFDSYLDRMKLQNGQPDQENAIAQAHMREFMHKRDLSFAAVLRDVLPKIKSSSPRLGVINEVVTRPKYTQRL